MKNSQIPDDVKLFISKNIDSVGKLEVLLKLASAPQLSWTCKNLSKELRSTDSLVQKSLMELEKIGLLNLEPHSSGDLSLNTYRFRSDSKDLHNVVQSLIKTYSIYHGRVIDLIYNKPLTKIQDFAQAFRIRKEEEE